MRLLVLLLMLWALPAMAQDAVRLDSAASFARADGDSVTLQLQLSQAAPYRITLLDMPTRVVLDIRGLELSGTDLATMPGADLFADIRSGGFRPGWSRLVLETREPYRVAQAAQQTGPGEAVIRIGLQPVSAEDYDGAVNAMSALWDLPLPTTPVVDPSRPQPFRIAIDPGHGGIDSGAVEAGLREADLMLAFSHELTEKLIRAGFEVVLTRRKDVFVGLEARMTEARAANADLLISLHADALPDGQATGATIFTWNTQADDRASQQLAARHDRADLVAGLDLEGTDDQIAETLMDMARADTQPRSEAFARSLSARMRQAGVALHRQPVKGAAFSVLKSPDIPSVLIELGFLTDPSDRANLTDPAWRARMSQAIADAATDWLVNDGQQAELRRH
ncbi:N-acetylmuramoyl-L-alanine amidase [Paracoccus aerodenitrificans]|uniref:N-acetylmuramoyl-L-alanine amidase n=1 Tax=Paracoccus aerodenitrificans TaxID=3017781 RepID=UPI0022F095A8|nr:N-acetylmuramoyl-L-alanine amidase [Paracoccus aerodenitrificans]WBU65175.1 N-acetylmuramoyl-L-alanine amidase [Paracoccus aerodenitrificans]